LKNEEGDKGENIGFKAEALRLADFLAFAFAGGAFNYR